VSAARRPSSTARRTLLTATAAGTVLAALWFVPSATATQDETQHRQLTTVNADTTTTETSTDGDADASDSSDSSEFSESTGVDTQLADTGSINTKPYIVGGTLFLGVGAGFVAYSVRRERTALS
jgi:LPXTG-motif cell wall-anchored protein